MSGRGIIAAEIFRAEQLSLAKRGTTNIPGSDPNDPAVGEMWPRTDLSPSVSNATTFGVMRVQGPTGTLDWPIIDIDDASKLGPDVYIGATLKIAEPGANPGGTQPSKTGFLPVTDQGGSLGSPRLLHNGVEYQAHDALDVSAIPDSVVSRWQFNDGSGPTATDSESSNDGTINGATYTTDAREGSHALDFTGGDYVDTNWLGVFDEPTFSVAAWVNADSLDSVHSVFDNFDGSTPQVSIQYNSSLNGLTWRLNDGSNQIEIGQEISENEWIHIVGVRDGEEGRVYFNGSPHESDTNSSLADNLENTDIWLGYRPDNDNPWEGRIDDVMVEDEAWTDQQVSDLYSIY